MQALNDKNNNHFSGSESVNGALFKMRIGDIPDRKFCKLGINSLINHLGIYIDTLTYITPSNLESPCMYGSMFILGETIPLESLFSWKDTIHIKKINPDTTFVLSIDVEEETSFNERVVASWYIEHVHEDKIETSPLVKKLEKIYSA